MTKIAFLGLGAMGARMATNLIKAGFDVALWNRSPGPLDAVASIGGCRASTPRAAAEGADFVITMVRDDDASRAVWLDADAGALSGLGPDAVGVESGTVTPGWVDELGAAVQARGARLLDAPVAGSRPQAEAGQLVHLVGGEAEAVARATPVLKVMGGAIHHAGPAGSGATLP